MLAQGHKVSSLIVLRADSFIAMDLSLPYNYGQEKTGFVPWAGFNTPHFFKGRHVAVMNGGFYSYFCSLKTTFLFFCGHANYIIFYSQGLS